MNVYVLTEVNEELETYVIGAFSTEDRAIVYATKAYEDVSDWRKCGENIIEAKDWYTGIDLYIEALTLDKTFTLDA